ncbi:hypothetical protein Trydic_g21593 [Trypoxylus dichotomus]
MSLSCECSHFRRYTPLSSRYGDNDWKTLRNSSEKCCVGLSAPQIGVGSQVFVMEFQEKHAKQFTEKEFKLKEMSLVPFTVVINPEIKVLNFDKVIYSESCESIKGFWADVPRYRKLLLTGFNEDADRIEIEATGWVARIIQHEMDHLHGILYTDVMDRKTLTSVCWEAVNERRGKVVLPFSPDT